MPRLEYLEFTGGMQRRTNRHLKLDNECDLIINAHGDIIGDRTKRLGYNQVGDTLQAGKNVLGLFGFYQKSGTDYHLAAINNSGDTQAVIKYNNAGTWTNITGATTFTAGTKMEFASFIDYCFIVGGATETTGSLTGTTYSTATNVTSAPKAKYPIVYKDKLYLLNCDVGGTKYPSRFYQSSVPSGSPAAITWDTTNWWEPVQEDDGEELMGGTVNGNELLLFKETTMHAWNNSSMWKVDDVGAASHRSIQTVGAMTFFLATFDEGYEIRVYAGGVTRPISGKLESIINTITSSQASGSFSASTRDSYKLYLGNLTIDGEAWSNCEVVYKISTNEFWINSFNDALTCYAPFRESGVRRIYSGDSDGEVMRHAREGDSVYSDDGQPIQFIVRTKKIDAGLPEQKKQIVRGYAFSTAPQGMTFNFRLDNGKWQTTKLTEEVQDFQLNPYAGYTYQVEVSETSTTEPCAFSGFVLETAKATNKT